MKRFSKVTMMTWVFLVAVHMLFSAPNSAADRDKLSFLTRGAPFEMPEIKTPVFPERTVNIVNLGAVGDGLTSNTKVFAEAIASCAEKGGGRVYVPPGIWLTGPIYLKSNIDLHLDEGALLLYSREFDDYPLIKNNFEGQAQYRCTSPVNAVDLENVAITGSGIIDGSGDAWRPVKRFKMTQRQWDELTGSGGVVNDDGSIWWPTETAMKGAEYLSSLKEKKNISAADVMPARDFLRPVMIRLVNCRNVLLDGPTFQNSPAWNIHPLMCENVIIRNITVRNPWYSQNGDGLDLESCKNVLVYASEFDVGDDAICLKSGKNEYGRRRSIPTENVVILNCKVYHGHGGVTTGSEMSGGIRNIWVSGCTFIGTDIGLRFKSTRGRGGIVEMMYFNNIHMIDIKNEAILIDLYYERAPNINSDIPPVDEGTPIFRNISFQSITSINTGTSIVLRGLPEMPIGKINFNNLLMTGQSGIFCSFSEGIEFKNLDVFVQENPVIKLQQCRSVQLETDRISQPDGVFLTVSGEQCADIVLYGRNFINNPPEIVYSDKAKVDAVVVRDTYN
ncbi:glycoside hydrolase family 28 protein [candidate division KSB1 bacterium]|nr:glycoside hydrolase family 28 protein [candidate division KSB1 bacterium]